MKKNCILLICLISTTSISYAKTTTYSQTGSVVSSFVNKNCYLGDSKTVYVSDDIRFSSKKKLMTVLFSGSKVQSFYLFKNLGMNLDWLSIYKKGNDPNSTYLVQCTWKRSYAMTCIKYQLKMYNKSSGIYDHALWISEYDHSWKGIPYLRDKDMESRYYFRNHFKLGNDDLSGLKKCQSGYHRPPGLSYTDVVFPKERPSAKERGIKLCSDGSEAIYNYQGNPICLGQ